MLLGLLLGLLLATRGAGLVVTRLLLLWLASFGLLGFSLSTVGRLALRLAALLLLGLTALLLLWFAALRFALSTLALLRTLSTLLRLALGFSALLLC